MHDETSKERAAKLKAWLDERSREDGLVVAVRSSMRALPVFWNWADSSDEAKAWEISALPALWANLASWLVAMRPSKHNKAAAVRASEYCDVLSSDLGSKAQDRDDFGAPFAGSAATFAAAYAGEVKLPDPKGVSYISVLYASSCGGAGALKSKIQFLDAALRDCVLIERGKAALYEPLWHGERNPLENNCNALSARLAGAKQSFLGRLLGGSLGDEGKGTNIWWDWYQRALDGRKQPRVAELEALNWRIGKQ